MVEILEFPVEYDPAIILIIMEIPDLFAQSTASMHQPLHFSQQVEKYSSISCQQPIKKNSYSNGDQNGSKNQFQTVTAESNNMIQSLKLSTLHKEETLPPGWQIYNGRAYYANFYHQNPWTEHSTTPTHHFHQDHSSQQTEQYSPINLQQPIYIDVSPSPTISSFDYTKPLEHSHANKDQYINNQINWTHTFPTQDHPYNFQTLTAGHLAPDPISYINDNQNQALSHDQSDSEFQLHIHKQDKEFLKGYKLCEDFLNRCSEPSGPSSTESKSSPVIVGSIESVANKLICQGWGGCF